MLDEVKIAKIKLISKTHSIIDDNKFIIESLKNKVKKLEEKRDSENNIILQKMYNKDIIRNQQHIIDMLNEISEYYEEIEELNKEV